MAAAGTAVSGPAGPAIELASRLAATALWGFGVWWLAAAVVLLVHYLRTGPLPYGLGWWGFTFPLGAYTVATLTLARAWDLPPLEWAGAGLFVLLVLFWVTVAGRTVQAVWTGEAWRPATPAAIPDAIPDAIPGNGPRGAVTAPGQEAGRKPGNRCEKQGDSP